MKVLRNVCIAALFIVSLAALVHEATDLSKATLVEIPTPAGEEVIYSTNQKATHHQVIEKIVPETDTDSNVVVN